MLPAIRIASPEEIADVRDECDLTATSLPLVSVFNGIVEDRAVLRTAIELDPVLRGPSDSRFMMFLKSILDYLRLSGAKETYFNVAVDDEKWIQLLEKVGARRMSTAPEYRYKVSL